MPSHCAYQLCITRRRSKKVHQNIKGKRRFLTCHRTRLLLPSSPDKQQNKGIGIDTSFHRPFSGLSTSQDSHRSSRRWVELVRRPLSRFITSKGETHQHSHPSSRTQQQHIAAKHAVRQFRPPALRCFGFSGIEGLGIRMGCCWGYWACGWGWGWGWG